MHDNGPVTGLNELEYINGKIYANVWQQEKIAVINPQTGQVEAWINLSGIQNPPSQDPDNVLNGIAYDAKGDRLFVTGKRWSQLYEIKLISTLIKIKQVPRICNKKKGVRQPPSAKLRCPKTSTSCTARSTRRTAKQQATSP